MAKENKQPTVVGGINLSTRTKSKTFWVAIISAVAVFANQITGAFGLDYSAQIEQGVNIIGSILTLLAGLGIIVDNNTKGIKDSGIAQTYTKPRNENVDPVQFQAEDYTTEQFIDSQQEEVTESVDGLRDVDQEEIEAEEADEAPIGLGENESYEETQAPLSDPEVKGKEISGGGHK
uniref:Holin n=1 Tax=Staphylococcus phage 184DA TaxID=3110532 RepID=A0AAU6MXU2_9CAUD